MHTQELTNEKKFNSKNNFFCHTSLWFVGNKLWLNIHYLFLSIKLNIFYFFTQLQYYNR